MDTDVMGVDPPGDTSERPVQSPAEPGDEGKGNPGLTVKIISPKVKPISL